MRLGIIADIHPNTEYITSVLTGQPQQIPAPSSP
jgi:hypothetical protein